MRPLGIFLNFLLYFNSLVSKKVHNKHGKTLLHRIGCAFDGCGKVVCTAQLHSFLSEFIGTRSACQKMDSPPRPHCYYTQFPALLRVTLQLDMKSLCFSKVISDFHSHSGRTGILEKDQKWFHFHRGRVNVS